MRVRKSGPLSGLSADDGGHRHGVPADARPLFQLAEVRSVRFRRVLEQVRRLAADADVPLLFEGESGTGKTLIARYAHDVSPRAAQSFHSVLLSALDDPLAGSELFGHTSGAFTGARSHRAGAFVTANGGTLFLDEIGKASFAVQRKLLHAIEYGEIRPLGADRSIAVDVRVMAASNAPLEDLVETGAFLADLYARIETFRVYLPALRERTADIPPLVNMYIRELAPICGYTGGALPLVNMSLMKAIQRARWPNNLRQLHASVRRLLLEAQGAPELLFDHCRGPLVYLQRIRGSDHPPSLEEIDRAMAEANDNVSLAARRLGIDRTTLYRRRKQFRGS